MDPINYVASLNDPTASVMAGYQTGLSNQAAQQNMNTQRSQLEMQQAQEARAAEMQPYNLQQAQLGVEGQQIGNQAAAQNMQAQATELARRDAFRADMAALTEKGPNATLQDFIAIETKYPELAGNIRQGYDAMDEAGKRTMGTVLAQGVVALQNDQPQMAKDLFGQYAEAMEASGDQAGAASARSMVQMLDADPNAVLPFAGLALNMLMPDVAGSLFNEGSDATVSRSEMVGPTLSVQTMNDGSTRVVDTATNQVLTGEAATQAINAARESVVEDQRAINAARSRGGLEGQQGLVGEINAEAAGGTAAGTTGIQLGQEAFVQVGNIRGNISNIDRAIEALDAGARTGQIQSRAPTWNAATLELRQLQNTLGLDIIGSVTFGALSEGELRLALDTALPANMQEADLRNWLVRKKDAQEKLMNYMDAQARFLSRPGNTLDKWLELVDSGQAGQGGQPAPQPAATPQAAPQPAAPSAAPSFMQFSGGN